MSGFSTSSSGGMPPRLLELLRRPHWRRASRRRRRRRSRCRPAAPPRPRPASRARISTCTTVDAGGIGADRPGRRPASPRRRRPRGGGDGVALLAGRAVGDVAHRIDRLVRRACGDQHALAGERPRLAADAASARRRRRFRSAPTCGRCRPRRLRPSRRHWARSRRRRRARAARRCGGSRHCSTSCGFIAGASRIGRLGREQDGAGEIVGVALRHLRHQIGGRRRHHDQVAVARQADVAGVEFALGIEQVGIDALAATARSPPAA